MKKIIFKVVVIGMVFLLLMGCGVKKEESVGVKVKDDKLFGLLIVYIVIEEEFVLIYFDFFKKKYFDVKLNIVCDLIGVIIVKLLVEGKNI